MQETLQLIITHLRTVWRFRWVGLVVASLVCMGGWVYVLSMPNTYRASTKVFIDTRSLLGPVMKGLAINTGVQSSTGIISRTLTARPSLEEIARKTDLDLTAKSPVAFEKLLNRLRKQIKVGKTKRTNIFNISYSNQSPKIATRVVEAVLNLFVERSLGDSRKDSTKTARFLDNQIKELEARLLAADERLKQFKQKNMGLMPGSSEGYFGKQKAQAAARRQAELELKEAIQARDEMASQLKGVDEMIELSEAAPAIEQGHPLDGRIQNLEQAIDELLLKYTARHPDVIAAMGQLARLRKQKEEDLAAQATESATEEGSGGPDKVNQMRNPMYQQLTIALGQAEARVASMKARVEEYKRREAELARQFDRALAVEIEYKRLNQDYGIDRRNYKEMLSRRKQLQMGEEISQSTGDVAFNIIEPPRQPTEPSSPNRPLLNAVVLLLGAGAGIGFAWLIGMLRPTFYSKDELARLSGLPVIGSVSRIWTPRERFRRRLEVTSFGVGCLGLLGVFSGLLVLNLYRIDLSDNLMGLAQRFL